MPFIRNKNRQHYASKPADPFTPPDRARQAGMATWNALLELYKAWPDLFVSDPTKVPIADVERALEKMFPSPKP
jgi:hypothetical protein